MNINDKYLNVLKRLYNTNRFKQKKVDLSMIQKACKVFNNPQDYVKYIHVTGTNGKGSVCKKLSETLSKSGYKTGLFISPHITTFRERIQINNEYIEKEYITEELERIYNICDKTDLDLTYFELVTLLSLNYFKDKNIDIGVMEVGLGGNLDATNVIDPLLSIITSIGMDHMDSLGYTQEEIAEKKSGIIKPGKPVVIGPDCYPRNVFIDRAAQCNSELYIVGANNYLKKEDLFDFDAENKEITKYSINVLKKHYPELFNKITNETIQYGLQHQQPCRREDVFAKLGKENTLHFINTNFNRKINPETTEKINKIILDVGHNQHGLDKLLSSLREKYPKCYFRIICGFSANKDKNEIIKTICSYADKVYIISPDHPRATKYKDLQKIIKDYLVNFNYDKNMIDDNKHQGNVTRNIIKAIEDCISSENKEEIIVICGSFFLMGEARKTFGYADELDPYELNELNPVSFKLH